jgi:Calcium-binding EGF domain
MARSNLPLIAWLIVVGSLRCGVHGATNSPPSRPGGLRATAVARATQAAPPPPTTSTVPVCAVASGGRNTFQTIWVAPRDVWRHLIFGRAALGTCLGVCASTMCREYPSYNVSGNRQNGTCQCLGTRIVCGRHGRVNGLTKDCDCFSGYQQVNNGICVDVNECSASLSSCLPNQECVNTKGSFSCAPRTCATAFGNPCGPGRACVDAPTGFTCLDIPGGVQCPAGCDPNASCVNNDCVCNEGFVRPEPFLPCIEQGHNTTIVPVAPPQQTNTTLPPKQAPTTTCGINAAVSHDNATRCECLLGYQGDDPSGAGCTDVDECLQTNACASNQECVNIVGSFSCIPRNCTNVFGNPCGPGRACVDAPTGFTCLEISGGVQCPAGCGPNSTCVNNGCICDVGFIRPQPFLPCVEQTDNGTVPSPQRTPVATCGTNAAVVPENATKCECLVGYQGDDPSGVGCTDMDECLQTNSCASNQECVNTAGSFSCVPRNCTNVFGNPCGPGSACMDTATGFTCQQIPGGVQCPAGCEPNSACVNNACICDAGFIRPQPFLPCVTQTGNNTLPPPTCGANAAASLDDATKCACLPGYQGDDPSGAGCTDIDECFQLSKPARCASNQKCSNTDGSFTCEPISCANIFGNPCGPGRACADTPTGYTCSDLVGPAICPAGCGPNSTCGFASPTDPRATCLCNAGFVRPNPALGCVPLK